MFFLFSDWSYLEENLELGAHIWKFSTPPVNSYPLRGKWTTEARMTRKVWPTFARGGPPYFWVSKPLWNRSLPSQNAFVTPNRKRGTPPCNSSYKPQIPLGRSKSYWFGFCAKKSFFGSFRKSVLVAYRFTRFVLLLGDKNEFSLDNRHEKEEFTRFEEFRPHYLRRSELVPLTFSGK